MPDNNITDREIDFSNMLLAIGLAFICLLNLSILVVFDLENNSTALAGSTVLIVITLLVVMKKYRKPIKNSITDKAAPNREAKNWKWFIAAIGCLPVGILGGLILDHLFPHNPACIIFMVVSGVFSAFLLVLNGNRADD